MNRKLVQFGAIVWCMVVSGCTVCENAMRTMKHEPAAFSWKHDRPRSTEVYEQWAERVWGEESSNCPELAAERDYYLGFRDGFVDYIWAGGNGEPPPVPPRYLWNVMLRSPEGKQRADLWFDGYRHGSRAARFGGYREMGTVRTSLVGMARVPNGIEYPADAIVPHIPDHVEPVPHDQILPEPPAAQALPAFDLPESAGASLAPPVPQDRPKATPISVAQIARPVDKQPAAFEALGLALLPTDQPKKIAASTLETPEGSRPVIRRTKPTGPSRARYRREVGQTNAAALREPASAERKLPVTMQPNSATRERLSASHVANQAVRDIVLNQSRASGKVAAAGHSEPVAAKRKHSASLAGVTPDLSSNPASRSKEDPARERDTSSLQTTDGVMSAIHTEQVPPKAEEPTLRLNAAGDRAGDPANSGVRILKTVTEPTREVNVKEHSASGSTTSPKITLSAGNDGQVERIVIAGSSTASTAPGAAVNPNTSNGTIKIRTTTEEVERLPTKDIGTRGRTNTQ